MHVWQCKERGLRDIKPSFPNYTPLMQKTSTPDSVPAVAVLVNWNWVVNVDSAVH